MSGDGRDASTRPAAVFSSSRVGRHAVAQAPDEMLAVARRVADQWIAMPGVHAVALGGSLGRTVLGTPERLIETPGDIDLYVYAAETLSSATRLEAIRSLGGRDIELDRQFWETDDAWIDGTTGVLIEAMYRNPGWIEQELDRVFIHHQASIGYTTSLADNVHDSVALADPAGWYAELQRRVSEPYPLGLRDAIVAKNHPILRDVHASYRAQIASAIQREDVNAVAHRVMVLLASFWDILFAINQALHPGEKRLVAFAEQRCLNRPDDLGNQITAIIAAIPSPLPNLLPRIDALLDDLDRCLGVPHL